MKRFKGLQFILGVVVGAIVFGGSAAIAAGIVAKPKTAEVVIDGKAVDLKGYIIEGRHYFQLRDLDAALAPGGKDFGIVWDGENNRVIIDTTKPYMPDNTNAQTQQPGIPSITSTDYSKQANPAIFDSYYTPEKYNADRQRIFDTGTIVNWGTKFAPQSADAIKTATSFFDSIAQLPELEKVRQINDFLCAHITYRSTVTFSGNDFWTDVAYGVCEEYADVFQYMCWRAGLPCLYISGITDTNNHAWNEVYADGKWLFYDGNLSDIRQSIALGEEAKAGHAYTDRSPRMTMYQKEVYVPYSTQ